MDYIDLYLIHWFKGYDLAIESYKAMEELYKEGKIRALGVSNFNVHHIMKLLENSTVGPTVNQVETHIALQNEFLQEYCESVGVKLEAYAPLMSTHINELLSNETMNLLAEKYGDPLYQIPIALLTEPSEFISRPRLLAALYVPKLNILEYNGEPVMLAVGSCDGLIQHSTVKFPVKLKAELYGTLK